MSDMVPTGSKYTDEQRTQAAIQYAIQGSFAKIEQELSIPKSTVHSWKQEEWWVEIVEQVRTEKADELDGVLTQLIDNSYAHALSELEKGNVTYSQAVIGGSVAYDKQRLGRNQPTSISGKAESMSSLANEFRALSAKWEEKQAKVVSTQNDTQVIDK